MRGYRLVLWGHGAAMLDRLLADSRHKNRLILLAIIGLTLPGYGLGALLLIAAPGDKPSAPPDRDRAAAAVAPVSSATASATWIPTAPPTWTATPSLTSTPTATITPSPSSTPTASQTPTPSATLTLTASATPPPPTLTPSPTLTPMPPPTVTATPTLTPTATLTETPPPTATVTPILTPTATLTETPTPTATVTPTLTPSLTQTPYPLPSLTPLPSSTPTLPGNPGVIAGNYTLWGCTANVGPGTPPLLNPINPSEAHYTWIQGIRTGIHDGVDLAIPVGTPIHAAGGGTVVFAGWSTIGYGNTVVVAHGETFTLYGHLSQINVACDQRIGADDVVGLAGSTGWSSGPHLHFEVRNAQWGVLNPQDFIGF